MQMVVMEKLSRWRFLPVRLLHRRIHSENSNCKTLKGNQIIVLTVGFDEGTVHSRLGKIEVTSELVAYVDGGCLGNPGPAGIGVVISGLAEGPVRIAKWIGRPANNV